ncbi:hypothetical protein NLI96_g3099 [Meripilus lineatus]|uniref:Peptidase M12A domain-containing protein n=1 Tax=Meripilus lineatus TaxID=2056292 RepID=A0AAD5YL82_9APHY|nr:hypothetical protein NLI96_g3099 [Physisporinus lineatus]
MNLAKIDQSSFTPTDIETSYILHEFGHVLGFHHEHQSPSRARVLTFNRENILEHYRNQDCPWSRKDIKQNIINVLKDKQISNYSLFDPNSIMMYPIEESYTEQEIVIPRNTQLSELDKAYAMVHYPRQRPHKRAPEWTISHALDVIGVHGILRGQILRTRDPEKIRDLFTRWNAAERSKKV